MTDSSTTDVETPDQTTAPDTAVEAPHVGTFAEHGVDPRIAQSLAGAGITTPFPIQSMTLPVALSGHDIIGQAKTGTGKTLGFGVPLLQRTAVPGDPAYDALPNPGKPQALVIVPTRELATQVAGDLTTASRNYPARILTVYGGRAYEPQIDALTKGVDVVVGTPGRLLDLAQQRHLDLSNVKCVVLDEADEMLDLGFLPDVERLIAQTDPARQTMLFSATMPGPVVAMARSYMSRPTHIRAVDPTDDGATVAAITQFAYRTHALDKVEVLARMLQATGRGLTIVFSRTKRTAASVAEQLTERGFAAASIHGDLGQGAREQALRAFRHGKVDVLVATDVAARGIDVEDVTHVINYQCPEDEKTYLHRIGRTGRAGNTGVAVTFVDWDELPRWSLIDKALGLGFGEPVETYSTSPNLYEDLGIPAGTTGRLPRGQRTRAGLEAEQVEDLGEVGAAKGRRPRKDSRDGAGSRDGGARGAGPAPAAEEGVVEERVARPRRDRQRRRTRNGVEVEETAVEAGSTATAPPAASAPAGAEDAERPRRRRRTRTRADEAGTGTDAAASAPAAD
ncbi:DEAD/DEAH box helicase [Kineococcus radiotolerans]|uniref:RNA helicase n=1 Tax=Kineococcus radiotolerans (strain ATCC BAA-149 / DSM 14245 / SRS30216) TaxID=266940 RepID=A6W765_KINRD|nr:DEAD/DEAH box helicase [Kineococcus radiotolerans]ABS02654.1 DEAD/DEAH box helicase domain protein [Kineococcus radiotolerans SRS30216 = ATCC BAA-149]